MANRFRADLIDVAWANEHEYGVNPPANSEAVTQQIFKSGQSNTAGQLWGQWGLVTGGVDLPNPTYEWTPFFGLGVLDRNMMFPVQGRERLEGRVGAVLMCHDASRLFMEQCIGLIFNGQNLLNAAGTGRSSEGTTFSFVQSSHNTLDARTAGQLIVASADFNHADIKASASGRPPVAIVIIADRLAENVNRYRNTWAYIGGYVGDSRPTILDVFQDRKLSKPGWNGILPAWADVSTTNGKFSVHSITREDFNNTSQRLGVTADDSENNASIVRPTLTQESFMIAARFRADDGSNFVVNYKGCKVARTVFNFEEGAPVNYGVDFIARDMRHNIGEDAGTGANTNTLKYAALGVGTDGSATATVPPAYMKDIRVTEQPHFYSRVELTFQGAAIARFRRFSITVDNQLDPRYYLTQNASATPADDRQILHEILEGRRNISFSGSLDMDDSGSTAYPPTTTSPTDAIFLRYLLNQAFTDADVRDQSVLKGLGIRIEVRRMSTGAVGGAGASSYAHDKMFIYLPSSAASQTVGDQDEVGLVLRSASHNVPAPPNIHVPVDIDGFAASMHMEFLDNVADGVQAWG